MNKDEHKKLYLKINSINFKFIVTTYALLFLLSALTYFKPDIPEKIFLTLIALLFIVGSIIQIIASYFGFQAKYFIRVGRRSIKYTKITKGRICYGKKAQKIAVWYAIFSFIILIFGILLLIHLGK